MNIRFAPSVMFFLTLLAPASYAQLVLTASNTYEPLLGHSATVSQYVAESPSDFDAVVSMTGEDQTWNFGSASFGSPIEATFKYLTPPFDDLPYANLPGLAEANLVQEYRDRVSEDFPDSVVVYMFFRLTDASVGRYGFSTYADVDDDGVADTVGIFTATPSIDLQSPATYPDQWSHEDVQWLLASGAEAVGLGTVSRSSEVVGWGTLVTPMGSAEALMIRESFTQTVFGIQLAQTQTIAFQTATQATGKTGLATGLSASLSLDPSGAVTEASYSTIQSGGGNPTAVHDVDEFPSEFDLKPNYPNPFNPSTTIPFTIQHAGHVTLTIHDALGREVTRVVEGHLSQGRHEIRWDAGSLPSGVYVARLVTDGQVLSRTLALSK